MNFKVIPIMVLAVTLLMLPGCAKQADPKRSIEKIQKEVVTMSVAQLESKALAYASAIRAQKAEIMKIQEQVQKMPMEKFFSNKSMSHKIATIGQEAEALFERYRIYVEAYQQKGGDLSKVQIEPTQPTMGGAAV